MIGQKATFRTINGEEVGSVTVDKDGWNRLPPEIAIRMYNFTEEAARLQVLNGELVAMFHPHPDGSISFFMGLADEATVKEAETGFSEPPVGSIGPQFKMTADSYVLRAAGSTISGESNMVADAGVIRGSDAS